MIFETEIAFCALVVCRRETIWLRQEVVARKEEVGRPVAGTFNKKRKEMTAGFGLY